MRDCSARASGSTGESTTTAYEMNLMPFVSSNLWAARNEAEVASLIRSERRLPGSDILATETTNLRFDLTQGVERFLSLWRMRFASSLPSRV